MTVHDLPKVNIYSREFKADPYPFYARLREEAPLHGVWLPMKFPAWLVTRYDDVAAVLKDDTRFIKDWRNAITDEQMKFVPWIPPTFKPIMEHLLRVDGDQHWRLRGLVHKAFSPRIIENMRARVETLANELLDQAERKGKFDLIKDYALPIPLTIISDTLGVREKDRPHFHYWAKMLMDFTSKSNLLWSVPPSYMLVRYLRRLIQEHRANPADDLTTALIEAEIDGDHLTDDEIVGMLFILLVAGHETTVNLIGSGMLALMEHPDQLRMLRANPDLNKSAIEELVRYVSPVEQATERYAIEDMEMHGIHIERGSLVLAVIASANRDESQFENGDELDITRQNNKHLSFGLGVHYCVGAPLARLEGQIALQTLVNRLPSLHLAAERQSLKWRTTQTVRGLEALPVAV